MPGHIPPEPVTRNSELERGMAREPSGNASYEACRSGFRTGDLVAFGGKSRISRGIKSFTKSKVSHVALMLREPLIAALGDTVFIAESTIETTLPDALHGEILKGVQIHRLSQRLDTYDGEAWWWPLPHRHHRWPGKERMIAWLLQTHAKRVKYDAWQAIGAGVDFWDAFGVRNERDFSTLFCSELVLAALQEWGILPPVPDLNPSEEIPVDCYKICDCTVEKRLK